MTVEFLREAEEELTEGALWYESKQPGLGVRFRDGIAHVVSRIAEDPTLWREREGGYRRVICPVFPLPTRSSLRGLLQLGEMCVARTDAMQLFHECPAH